LGLTDFDAPDLRVASLLCSRSDGVTAKQIELAQHAIEYAADARAPNTRAAYAEGVLSYAAFARSLGYPVELPPVDGSLTLWVAEMADQGRKWSTIRNRLNAMKAALNSRRLSLPPEWDDVQKELDGICRRQVREFGGPHKKDALTKPLMERVLMRSEDRGRIQEDVALLELAADGLDLADLAGLRPEWITSRPRALVISMPAKGRWANGARIIEVGRRGGPLCPAAALEELVAERPFGPLFRRRLANPHSESDERQLTPQALGQRLRGLVPWSEPGVALDPVHWTESQLEELVECARRPLLMDVRDRAVLTTMFASGGRGSSVEIALWRHLTVQDDRLILLIPWSKMDQKGKGFTVPLPITTALLSPGAALLAWRERLQSEIGGDPLEIARDIPIFVSLHSSGNALTSADLRELLPLSRDEVSDMVKRRASAAKIPGDFSSHSIRAGVATSLIDAHVPDSRIATAVDWKSTQMVHSYDRSLEAIVECQEALGIWEG
jgi:hypothetical protein